MKKYIPCFVILLLIAFLTTLGQVPSTEALFIQEEITIDGELMEAPWQQTSAISNFKVNFPYDTLLPSGQTYVRVLYNKAFLYIGAKLLHGRSKPKAYIASSLRRDYPFIENDAFGVIIDAFDDKTNGYGFYVSAYGVQREEQIFTGGTTTDATWDIKWFSAVKHHEDGWTVELAIPFRYLRFKEELAAWNINFLRNDVTNNERSSWAATPRNFELGNLAFYGKLAWQTIPKELLRTFHLYPV